MSFKSAIFLLVASGLTSSDLLAQHLQSGDRSFHVFHMDLSNPRYRFFAPFEPVPDSPTQESIYLTELEPIVASIPQLGMPSGYSNQFHTLSVNYSIIDQIITIDAIMDFDIASGNAVIGQNEYLLPLGNLPAGQYEVTVNKTTLTPFASTSIDPTDISGDLTEISLDSTGISAIPIGNRFSSDTYSFVVHAVPEPTSSMILLTSLGVLVTQRRRAQATRRNAEASVALGRRGSLLSIQGP